MTTAEDVLKVFAKFNPRMDFSDSPAGFFGGLQEQFSRLASEERLASQWEGHEEVDYPSFGSSEGDFETVVRPFYAAWGGFSTKKSFAWRDVYRYSEAPDRRVRRMMEKENRRLREEGIREFNDAVRSLVAFVKKRDPRYKANAQNEAQRQESLRNSVAAQAARSRAMNQAKMKEHVVPAWAQSEQLPSDEESSESEIESFECVVCNKSFKSQKQLEAHERSKKHLKAVKDLCREMQFQSEELDLDSISYPGPPVSAVLDKDRAHNETSHINSVPDAHSSKEDTESQQHEGLGHPVPESEDDDHRSSASVSSALENPSLDSMEDDYAPRDFVKARLYPNLGDNPDELPRGSEPTSQLADQLSNSTLAEQPSGPKVGKAKQKRAKKAARSTEQPTGSACRICSASFTSRTKLFAHLDQEHTQSTRGVKGSKRS